MTTLTKQRIGNKYKDGEETEFECKVCKVKLFFEMSFRDGFSYSSGHYTYDVPTLVCPKCEKVIEYEGEE
jgi:hypothetical protein